MVPQDNKQAEAGGGQGDEWRAGERHEGTRNQGGEAGSEDDGEGGSWVRGVVAGNPPRPRRPCWRWPGLLRGVMVVVMWPGELRGTYEGELAHGGGCE